jgi:pimeloyl-ACP methyl ester carboxylesterase
MPKVYCLSGLGADQRVFNFIALPGVEMVHVKWLPPERHEPLGTYARRLLAQFDAQPPVTLLGVSFGGIVAQEIAALLPCRRVIILSSIKSPAEMPLTISLVRRTGVHRLVPGWLLKAGNVLTGNYYFSIRTREEARLLQAIVRDTDPAFLRWAVHEVVRWQPPAPVPGLVHFHGTADRIFPADRIQQFTPIPGGGHFMVVQEAPLLSRLISEALDLPG